jgi:hypothetical protein
MAPARPPPSTRSRVLAHARPLLLAAVLAAAPLPAAALGTLTAQSVRNEPLRSVVVLPRATGTPPPSVRLASTTAYERLGFVRDPALATATVRVVTEPDGQRFARIDSDTPVAAAELVLLLESDGGVRRLYRLNLGSSEPADRVAVRGSEPLARGAAAQRTVEGSSVPYSAGTNVRDAEPPTARTAPGRGALAASSADPAAAPSAAAPSPGIPAAAGPAAADGADRSATTATALATPIAPQARPNAITVAEGADLDALAQALRPPGATLEQSAAALWRANRAAFIGRPPRPLAGALLQVPSEAAVLGIDQAEARAVVAGFAAEPLTVATAAPAAAVPAAAAPQPARAAPARGPAAVPSAAGGPTAVAPATGGRTAIDPAPPRPEPAARDRVVLSAPRPAPAGAARTAADAAFEAELDATVKRIAALEKRLADLRAGLERTTDRELALMRELVDVTRRTPPRVAARGTP